MTFQRLQTASERKLAAHLVRWGSDGYPVHKLGRHWTWDYLDLRAPTLYPTKRAATEAFERYAAVLDDCRAWELETTGTYRQWYEVES